MDQEKHSGACSTTTPTHHAPPGQIEAFSNAVCSLVIHHNQAAPHVEMVTMAPHQTTELAQLPPVLSRTIRSVRPCLLRRLKTREEEGAAANMKTKTGRFPFRRLPDFDDSRLLLQLWLRWTAPTWDHRDKYRHPLLSSLLPARREHNRLLHHWSIQLYSYVCDLIRQPRPD